MSLIIAKWHTSEGCIFLHDRQEGLSTAFFNGREVIPIEMTGIPAKASPTAPFREVFYPTLHRDLNGRVTRADFQVRGLGGCFWKWFSCCKEQEDVEKPLLGASSTALVSDEPRAPVSRDLPQSAVELVKAYEAPGLSGKRRRLLLQMAGGVVERFSKSQASPAAIRELVTLVQIPHPELTHRILEQLIVLVRDQVTLSLPLIQGIATALEHAYFESLNSDDLVQIMNTLVDRLEKTHWDDTEKTALQLQAIVRVLNIMGDLDVKGLHRVKIHEPVYKILDELSESKSVDVAVWATCAKQALVRIPNNETVVRLVLRKCKHLGLGILNLASLVKTHHASLLVTALGEFRQACEFQDLQQEWHDQIRVCEWLLLMREIDAFKTHLTKAQTKHPFFVWTLVGLCDRTIQTHPVLAVRKVALETLIYIFQNEDKRWSIEDRLWDNWVRGRNYPKALKRQLTAMLTAYPQLRELNPEATQGWELVQKTPDAQAVSPHALAWLEVEDDLAPRSLLAAAQRRDFPIETKLESVRKTFLGDEVFQEDAACYVPVLGAKDPRGTNTFDLSEMAMKFVSGDQKVMLILGDAGSGKSLFSETMAAHFWRQYEPGGEIPLFISLPSLHDPVRNAIGEFLGSFGFSSEEIEELRQKRRFVFVLDGFDEINKLHNLYATNQLHHWNCHVIITCRTQHLTSVSDYTSYFIPYHREKPQHQLFSEAYVAPFSSAQRSQFLRMYVPKAKTAWDKVEQYEKEIDRIPGLAGLTQNPFILKITAEVLPDIVIKHQAEHPEEDLQITQTTLYDAFIWHWFERQKSKIIASGQDVNARTLVSDFHNFCKALAKKMTDKGVTVVPYVESSDLFSEAQPDEWESFFGNRNPRAVIARTGAPLRKFGPNQWGFLHDTLRSYFYAKGVYS